MEANFAKLEDFKQSKYRIDAKLLELDHEIAGTNRVFSTVKSNLHSFQGEAERRLAALEETTAANSTSVERFKRIVEERNQVIRKVVTDMGKLSSKKADQSDHLHLKQRLDVFECVESTKAIKEIFLPRLTSFIGLVDKLESSHEQMRGIIRDFDQNMMTKANKSTVDELLLE